MMSRLCSNFSWLRLAILAVCVGLAGCEGGDLVNPNERLVPGKAVANPFGISNASDEVFSRNIGAVDFVTVDFSNTKGESPKVHTVVDDVKEITGQAAAKTQPASRPAAAPAEEMTTINGAAGLEDIKIASQQKPGDKITMNRDNEANVDLWITSESGKGSVLLERVAEGWPPIVRLHLSYGKDKAFTRLDGLDAFEVVGDRQVVLKTTLDKEHAKGQVNIPSFSRAPQILIQWADTYK